jgi:hypothetical protein
VQRENTSQVHVAAGGQIIIRGRTINKYATLYLFAPEVSDNSRFRSTETLLILGCGRIAAIAGYHARKRLIGKNTLPSRARESPDSGELRHTRFLKRAKPISQGITRQMLGGNIRVQREMPPNV